MDYESYEQLELPQEFVGDRARFLKDGMRSPSSSTAEKPIGIALPDQLVLEIVEADPVVKGHTAASSYKPAILENVRPHPRSAALHRDGRARSRRHQRTHLPAPRRLRSTRHRPGRNTVPAGLFFDKGIRIMARSALLNVMVQPAFKAGKSLSRDFGEVQNLQVSSRARAITSPRPTARLKRS